MADSSTATAASKVPSLLHRSLSLPYSIEAYQAEIRHLEARIRQQESHRSVGDGREEGKEARTSSSLLRRSRSSVLQHDPDQDIITVLRKQHCSTTTTQEEEEEEDPDFVVGEEPQSQQLPNDPMGDATTETSFLPGFGTCSPQQGDYHPSLEPSSGLGSCPNIAPIAEDEVGEQLHHDNNNSSDSSDSDEHLEETPATTSSTTNHAAVLRATETIDALARLFELPSGGSALKNVQHSTNERSPVSVRELPGADHNSSSASQPTKHHPKHVTTQSRKNEPSMAMASSSSSWSTVTAETNSDSNKARRSIFGQSASLSSQSGVSSTKQPSQQYVAPSFSGFGIFSWEAFGGGGGGTTSSTGAVAAAAATAPTVPTTTTTTTTAPSTKQAQPQQRPQIRTTQDEPEFRLLTTHDRANSMPARLPRKSSLKRIPSGHSSSTAGGGGGSASQSTMGTAPAIHTNNVKRTVSFGKLETREYSIALSDHPSCSYGPPISLGWDFCDKESVPLDDYEFSRSPRRSMHQMILSYNVRRYLLLKRAGYTHDELEAAMNEVDRVKRERLVTDLLLPASHIDETLEDVMRRIKGIFGPKEASSVAS